MDTVLQSFERAREWADLIKYLQRLNKVTIPPSHPSLQPQDHQIHILMNQSLSSSFFQVLTKYPQFTLVPEKITVAKRLAQCLNPALPSGVHLKVYISFAKTSFLPSHLFTPLF